MTSAMGKGGVVLAGLLATAGGVGAQGTRQDPPVMTFELGYGGTSTDGDAVEYVSTRGLWYSSGNSEIRADSVVVRMDRDEFRRLSTADGKGLPSRGAVLPASRRALGGVVLAQRFQSFLESFGSPRPASASHQEMARLFRSVYMEGNLVIIDQGVEVLTASSMMFSIPDDRVVFKDVELRLISKREGRPERVLVLRAPKLVKQGQRTTGRNVSLTTCSAGKPHFEVLSEQIEILERGDEFEVFSRGNNLAFSGRRTVPLPDAHFYTSEQSDIPLRSVRARYSSSEGVEIGLDFGASMNRIGGGLHRILTGRPADEFRGEWRLGLGYIENRGNPVDGELIYRGGDLYEGRTKGFYLDGDRGPNRRFINADITGNPITERYRQLVHSENRFHLGDSWTLDLTAFSASDPSVYPEFHVGEFQEAELPESSLHLRHADANRLFTLTGRTNLATFSYQDDRSLAPAFVEEAPLATYDVFSEPLLQVWDTDVLLTSSTSAGWLEHEYDPRFGSPVPTVGGDRTRRLDQELELAAPFLLGPFAVRPHASARFTHYDNSVTGMEQERWAFDAGVSMTTRLARTFESVDADGNVERIRHSIYPSVSFGHLYKVDGRAADLYQFDRIDSLNEHGVIRVGLLNRFQQLTAPRRAERNPFVPEAAAHDSVWEQGTRRSGTAREFLFLDLAQNFLPISDRDNNGDLIGLGEYEVIWRPQPSWLPVPNLAFLVEGEHDWANDRVRTFNSLVRFGEVFGIRWHAGYRTDYLVDGAVLYGMSTNLFGRWTLTGNGAFDLQTDEQLSYGAMLVRHDHDWIITMALTFDVIQDDTSFRIDFEPLFGGLSRRRSRELIGIHNYGADAVLDR